MENLFVMPSTFERGLTGGDMTMIWRPGVAAPVLVGDTIHISASHAPQAVEIINVEHVTFVLTDLIDGHIASVEMNGRPIHQELIHLLALTHGFTCKAWRGRTPRERMGNWLTDAGHAGRVCGWSLEWRPLRGDA